MHSHVPLAWLVLASRCLFASAGRAAFERVMSRASLVFGLKEIVAVIGTCALEALLAGEDEFDTTLALYQTDSLCREVMLSVLIEPFRRPVDKLHLRVYQLDVRSVTLSQPLSRAGIDFQPRR